MIIGKSLPEYILIRAAIFALRSIAPSSAAVLVSGWFKWIHWPKFIRGYAAIEVLFYLLVYLPRKRLLQPPVKPPENALATPAQRRALLQRCLDETDGIEDYVHGWYPGSTADDSFRREDLREWLAWALFSAPPHSRIHEEIEPYISLIETRLEKANIKLQDGRRRPHSSEPGALRLTLDPVRMKHHPFTWYMIIHGVDQFCFLTLYRMGFRHYRSSLLNVFPPRPITVFSRPSQSSHIPYWWITHTSETKYPIVFLHGIGVGLHSYTALLRDLIRANPGVGILVLEILPISARITTAPLLPSEFLSTFLSILSSLNITSFILAGHSYGTALCAQILKSPLSTRVKGLVLIDPITFLLHQPSVAYNFVYRTPKTANEWELWYFASREPDTARAISRYFFWAENLLWKEDVTSDDLKTCVVIGGQDLIIDAAPTRKYLTNNTPPQPHWNSGNLEVLYYDNLDHAQVVDNWKGRKDIVMMLTKFSYKELE